MDSLVTHGANEFSDLDRVDGCRDDDRGAGTQPGQQPVRSQYGLLDLIAVEHHDESDVAGLAHLPSAVEELLASEWERPVLVRDASRSWIVSFLPVQDSQNRYVGDFLVLWDQSRSLNSVVAEVWSPSAGTTRWTSRAQQEPQ